MGKTILITGGAGFIGSHLADALLERGDHVRILDNLTPQVHGDGCTRPDYLNPEAELIIGDVCDPDAVRASLDGVDAVYHLASLVGVGQSMYEVADYTRVNNLGTAVLMEALIENPVGGLVVTSSVSIYGEGLYARQDGTPVIVQNRTPEQLRANDWELRDEAGDMLMPILTPETKTPNLASVYALSKYDQEKMCLLIGGAYDIPTTALRFFNVYGTRQALSNPYTGVLAIFASRLLNGNAPLIFEDGCQKRDFIHIDDLVQGLLLALETPAAAGEVFNIASGNQYTIYELAQRMAAVMHLDHLVPEVTGKYRVGDIRHCFADISKAERILGYQPQVQIEDGMRELAAWLEGQTAQDRVLEMTAQLSARGLAR